MYYQNFKYPAKYALYFSNDRGRVHLDIMRAMVKVTEKEKPAKYYHAHELPKVVIGIDRATILEKFN